MGNQDTEDHMVPPQHVQPSCNHTNKLQNIINSSFNLSHFSTTSSCLTPWLHILMSLLPKHTLLLSGRSFSVHKLKEVVKVAIHAQWYQCYWLLAYPNSRVLFQQHHIQSMNQSWVVAFISCTMGGNHVYDTYFHTYRYLPWCWRSHTTLVKYSLGRVSYEQELTVQ